MIKLSNGHELEFLTASGALAFDGRGWPWEWPLRWTNQLDPRLFTIVVKTLMPDPWKGNLRWSKPWRVVKLISKEGEEINPLMAIARPQSVAGAINAIGLTGPGIEKWLERDYPVIQRNKYKVIVSVTGPEGGRGCLEMARRLDSLTGIVGIEFNASCPNTDPEFLRDSDAVVKLCHAIKQESRHPLLLKLSFAQPYLKIAKETQGVVEAISINSVPWKVVFGERPSPLARYGGGGVSGGVAQYWTWQMVSELSKNTTIPVVGSSIWHYEDIARLRAIGASAWHFGTIFLPYPWKPTRFVRRWQKEGR